MVFTGFNNTNVNAGKVFGIMINKSAEVGTATLTFVKDFISYEVLLIFVIFLVACLAVSWITAKYRLFLENHTNKIIMFFSLIALLAFLIMLFKPDIFSGFFV